MLEFSIDKTIGVVMIVDSIFEVVVRGRVDGNVGLLINIIGDNVDVEVDRVLKNVVVESSEVLTDDCDNTFVVVVIDVIG